MKLFIQKAKVISNKLPDIKIKSKISKSIDFGDTYENKSGVGEDFWDYKEYNLGDPLKKIDWKKSAKFDKIFVKNQRNENSKNIWFWNSQSMSMNFRNSNKIETKETRGLIIGLILMDLFLKSGEKVGIVGSEISLQKGERNLTRLASEFLKKKKNTFESRIKKNDTVFFISDFLGNPKKIKESMLNLSENRYLGLLIRVLDDSEVNFPYKGRNQFFDPVSGLHKLFNKSENMKEIFKKKS